MVISFQSKQPLFSRSLGQRKKWASNHKMFCNKDGEFRCSRFRYFFVLYKQTMLTTSCIIPWDIGFVDPPISSKIKSSVAALDNINIVLSACDTSKNLVSQNVPGKIYIIQEKESDHN